TGSCCSSSRSAFTANETPVPQAAMTSSSCDPLSTPGREGMVLLDGGTFSMGNSGKAGFPADGEGPVHDVTLRPFYVDPTTVTNAQFDQFVRSTRYKTEAERFGWSYVFAPFLSAANNRLIMGSPQGTPWWYAVKEAYWYQPEGPGTDLEGRMDHPVVHISYHDALAYCKWKGKRLLTEAEWEYAARGGLDQKVYPWGDEFTPDNEHMCNIWQGTFPEKNTARDGYIGTAPAQSFRPNGFGLYNVSGNVWEWTSDWFSAATYTADPRDNPRGPDQGDRRSMRGGSFLCHKSYCNRYRVAARSSNTPDSSSSNIGFRCAADV
ncbi:MAG: serine/threonine protein phosphatase, partial [Paenibacillus sp.]|nr:serine/threonine protein phosphatase [Paenibacillus sp.]